MQTKSVREVVAKVRTEFKLNSADTLRNITDRYIASELQSTTIKYVFQRSNRRMLWNSPSLYQILPCVEMVNVPLSECCNSNINCQITRSKYPLPKIVEGNSYNLLIQGVYSIDYPNYTAKRFLECTVDRYENILKLNLKTKDTYFWIHNQYLYTSSQHLAKCKVIAYFSEDIPESLQYFPGFCGNPLAKGCCPASDQVFGINDRSVCCPTNPLDLPSKIPSVIEDDVVKEVANKILATYKRSVADNTENRLDETK